MKVHTKNFQRFLRKHGWSLVETPNKRLVWFESAKDAEGDWFSVTLPADMAFADASRRIDDALNTVAEALTLPKQMLILAIERWDRDLINTRLNSRAESVASIPLSLATIIVDDLRSFLGYAAYNEFSPAKFFPKAGKVATEFAASCCFGHTFEGSFGMTIECPLRDVRQLSLLDELAKPPFERLVTQRIATGFLQFQEAIEKKDPAPLLAGYEAGMNANMLRSLSDIFENLESSLEIEYSINWSPEIAPPEFLKDAPVLRFNGLAQDLARHAANELEREDEEQPATVVSYVVSLKSEMPLSDGIQDQFEHVITLDWEREQGEFVRIRVVLPAGEYKKACDAHKHGRKILVTGIPEKEGRFWILTRPSEIKFAT